MIVLGDLSGIQEYLFQVHEIGGKQARSLRFRSLFIQLLAEAIGIKLIRAAGLDEGRIIFSAAGKFAIDGAGMSAESLQRTRNEALSIANWLRDNTHARLRANIVIHHDPKASMVEQYATASRSLQREKLRAWSRVATFPGMWASSELLASILPDFEQEARRDAALGQQATQPNHRYIVLEEQNAEHGETLHWDVAGLRARFAPNAAAVGDGYHSREISRLARHIPRNNGEAIEFVDLAKHARGAPMLSVLKADADSLGAAMAKRLQESRDLGPLRDLSNRLDGFFAGELNQQMAGDSRWSKLYTVFSGGDDILLVGPWDIAIDFAGHLNQQFRQRFENEGLTLSAGVAIVKPKFPIRLAAQQAERLLDQAKVQCAPRASRPKEQFAGLGGLWKWEQHDAIVQAGKQLADWVDADVIQRGWLHTLLELAMLRRGQSPARSGDPHPAMATARLAYHVARNWPKPPHPARQWIDGVLREFDQYESTSHIETIHLPAIIRYAMLATRSPGDNA